MHRWQSIGYMAAQFQRSIFDIYDAASELEIKPIAELNDVVYFDAVAVVRLRSRLAEGAVGMNLLKEQVAEQNAKQKID